MNTAATAVKVREELGLTQREVAQRLEVSSRSVGRWENEGAPLWYLKALEGLRAETQKA